MLKKWHKSIAENQNLKVNFLFEASKWIMIELAIVVTVAIVKSKWKLIYDQVSDLNSGNPVQYTTFYTV